MVESASSWTDLKLNPQLLRAIEDAGFGPPTEIQQKGIPLIHGGQHVIGIAQTGTGKTAAYLLPLLVKVKYAQGTEPRALILVPTKELVVQVLDHATRLSKYTDLRMVAIYGGVGPKTQIEALNKGVDVIIATPGRFLELYQRNEIPVKQIKTLVLDEADRMMEMGFLHQLKKIQEVIPSKRQNLLFSATFSEKVERLSNDFLEFPVKLEVSAPSTPAAKVEQMLYHVPNRMTKISLVSFLLQDTNTFNRVIIFTRTKEVANNLANYLDRKGLGPVRAIHSNKGQNTRINAMNEFKEGHLRILVSTDVSARGIDVVKVSHVINFDVPILYEDYVHRIGRTGRAFQEGKAITLVTHSEEYHISNIEKLIREKIPVMKFPSIIPIEKDLPGEAQEMAKAIDLQKRREDPDFKGAFHERQRKRK
ncbi:MAG: DEAD/DEAH box helicase [Azospira oryzae]|nr:MAG: DEAD/DEAH box helicase [Azospira oryzae]